MFIVYTGFQVLLTPAMFALDHVNGISGEQYWYADSVGEIINVLLRFAIIHEIFHHLLRPYVALQDFGTRLIRWAVVLLLLVAVLVTIYAPPNADGPRLIVGLQLLNRTVSLVQCGLMLFLFLFSSYFGLSWRSHLFGIGLGLGVFASLQLALYAFLAHVALLQAKGLVELIWFGAYDSCVLIWLFYFLAPEPARRPVTGVPAHNLESWNLELQRLLQR